MPAENHAPLILFVYNRADHLRHVLAAFDALRGAEATDLIVFSDAAKDEAARDAVREVRDQMDDYALHAPFQSVKVIKAETNKGLAQSIIDGVSDVMKEYGRAIVLEDDLCVSPDFLEYMNGALAFYQNDPDVWAISGYSFPMKPLEKYDHDVFVALRGCSWGWATWQDRWETVDWQVSDYKTVRFNPVKRSRFGKWGRDMPIMLDANVYGRNHSWAIRWCYSAFLQKKYTVYPKVSRVKNIGTDGSGTNYTKASHRFDTSLSDGTATTRWETVKADRRIRRCFSRKYIRLPGIVKWNLYWLFVKMKSVKKSRDQ